MWIFYKTFQNENLTVRKLKGYISFYKNGEDKALNVIMS